MLVEFWSFILEIPNENHIAVRCTVSFFVVFVAFMAQEQILPYKQIFIILLRSSSFFHSVSLFLYLHLHVSRTSLSSAFENEKLFILVKRMKFIEHGMFVTEIWWIGRIRQANEMNDYRKERSIVCADDSIALGSERLRVGASNRWRASYQLKHQNKLRRCEENVMTQIHSKRVRKTYFP